MIDFLSRKKPTIVQETVSDSTTYLWFRPDECNINRRILSSTCDFYSLSSGGKVIINFERLADGLIVVQENPAFADGTLSGKAAIAVLVARLRETCSESEYFDPNLDYD